MYTYIYIYMCVRTYTQCIVYNVVCSIVVPFLHVKNFRTLQLFCLVVERHPFTCKTTAHDTRAAVKYKTMPQLVTPMGNGKFN